MELKVESITLEISYTRSLRLSLCASCVTLRSEMISGGKAGKLSLKPTRYSFISLTCEAIDLSTD